MVAVIYGRVSTEDQAKKGYSLPEQMRACRQKAEELGATRILEFTDDVSGDLLDRPGLTAAREAIRKNGIKHFICYDPDRFSRKLMNQLIVTQEIERAGCGIVFVQHDYQRTPEGQLFYQLRGAVSEFEKAKILERTARGKRGKMRQGRIPAYVDPFGYRFMKGQGTIEVDEEQAATVRQIFTWFVDHQLSIRSIVSRLNESGTPAARGSYWYRVSVRRILGNETYVGRLYLNRYDTTGLHLKERGTDNGPLVKVRDPEEWVAIEVPAIITEDQFRQAQKLLERAKHSRERADGSGHLLSGLVECGCGSPMMHKNNSRWTRYLACSRRFQYKDYKPESQFQCAQPYVTVDKVEAHVLARVESWIFHEDELRRELDRRSEATASTDEARELAEVIRKIEDADKERKRLAYLFQKDLIDPSEGEQQLEELRKRLARLHTRKQALEAAAGAVVQSTESRVESLGDTLRALREEWADLTPTERRHTVRLLVERIILRGKESDQWEVIPLA